MALDFRAVPEVAGARFPAEFCGVAERCQVLRHVFAHAVTIFRGDLPEMWMPEMRKVSGWCWWDVRMHDAPGQLRERGTLAGSSG
jgi:hypothetical protein